MSEKPARPAWFARREIAPFTLDDAEVAEVLAGSRNVTYIPSGGNMLMNLPAAPRALPPMSAQQMQ